MLFKSVLSLLPAITASVVAGRPCHVTPAYAPSISIVCASVSL